MARLIFKAPYYKPGHTTRKGQSRGGYAEYIAKREGVEILRSGMADYIGNRRSSNGLFSDEDAPINLSKIHEVIDNHPGNIWGFIISLRREDAERLGYSSAEQWINLLRSRRNDIAKEMGIAPANLRWVAAYHNKEVNPHVHMLVWSSRPQEPFLSPKGIHNIKKTLAGDIFRQENLELYKKQTEVRDDLKARYRKRIAELIASIRENGIAVSPELHDKFARLSLKLSSHKGKKIYGYLDKSAKKLTDEIVGLLARDEKIAVLYDLWYRYHCEVVRTYTDTMPAKIPLEENIEFKSVRNEVVSAAAELLSPPSFMMREIPEAQSPEEDPGYLETLANLGNVDAMVRLGRYYYNETDETDEAEYWLKSAADEGNVKAMYLIYTGYRDGKFTDHPGDGMKYLRMAADRQHAYAEYAYAMQADDRMPNIRLSYLMRASEHGCPAANYEIGRLYYENGQTEQGLAHFEKAAEADVRLRMRIGLFYYYTLGNRERGMELLTSAAEQGYAPAKQAIQNIQNGQNALIVIGLCDLFYYMGNLIEEQSEDLYRKESQVDDIDLGRGIDRRQRKEVRAKRQGLTMGGF